MVMHVWRNFAFYHPNVCENFTLVHFFKEYKKSVIMETKTAAALRTYIAHISMYEYISIQGLSGEQETNHSPLANWSKAYLHRKISLAGSWSK